jgi:hypothetical protein
LQPVGFVPLNFFSFFNDCELAVIFIFILIIYKYHPMNLKRKGFSHSHDRLNWSYFLQFEFLLF